MDLLRRAAQAYAARHAGLDGLVATPVPGLMMKYVEAPGATLRAVSRPAIGLVLQGAKQMQVGDQERVFAEGQSFIIGAEMPVLSRILRATSQAPYLAVTIELEMATLRELAAELVDHPPTTAQRPQTLFGEDAGAALIDCALRLTRLIDRPEAIPVLRPAIARELHYWLLAGPHGAGLRTLADPSSHAGRLSEAIALLRAEYRSRVPVERLAARAGMSLTAFHRHFKDLTSVTPGQYQKRLRLIEARRLMLEEGLTASSAAFQVGYESVSQFSREYRRLYQAPPRRDALRRRSLGVGFGGRDEQPQTLKGGEAPPAADVSGVKARAV